MHLLLTNDDGIYARGLSALYQELSEIADCLIVAPETEQSAVGHAITIARPLMVRQAIKNGNLLGYGVSGTPADCVKIGIKALTNQPVDLVVSGINIGANVGTNVIYSGTVSAATEGAILGIPAIAISLDSHRRDSDFSFAAKFARRMALFMLNQNPLKHIPLNINIPPQFPKNRSRGLSLPNKARQARGKL